MEKSQVTRAFSIGTLCSSTVLPEEFGPGRRHSSSGIRAVLRAPGNLKSSLISGTSRDSDVYPNILTPDSIPQFTIPRLSVYSSMRCEGIKDLTESEADSGSASDQESLASLSPAGTRGSTDRRAERSFSDPLSQRRPVLQREVSYPWSQRESLHYLDPASQAALSLPHLTKVTTPYGFITLSQSPQMASEEVLLCQGNRRTLKDGAGALSLDQDDQMSCCVSRAAQQPKEDSVWLNTCLMTEELSSSASAYTPNSKVRRRLAQLIKKHFPFPH